MCVEELFSAAGPIVAKPSNDIGIVDIRDSMHFEIDFEIHTLPTDHSWRCPFYVVDGIWFLIDGPEEMMVLIVKDLGLVNTRLINTKLMSVEAGGQYHVELDWSQDYFVATVNDVVMIEKTIGGHSLAEDRTIMVGNAERPPGNVTVSNILICEGISVSYPLLLWIRLLVSDTLMLFVKNIFVVKCLQLTYVCSVPTLAPFQSPSASESESMTICICCIYFGQIHYIRHFDGNFVPFLVFCLFESSFGTNRTE